jgi:acetamidase/formamidase
MLSSRTHTLPADPANIFTNYFDAARPPVLTIAAGDTVSLQTAMLHGGRLRPGMTLAEVEALRATEPHNVGNTVTGPIYIDGAEPGDVLEIRIVKLRPRPFAVSYVRAGTENTGALPEDFPAGQIKSFVLDLETMTTEFAPGITVPLRPFLGIMAVASQEDGPVPVAVPREFGGNMDCKELTAGSALYLPVFRKGALFSAGDAHAAQGDGEVCLTALETAMEEAVLRFIVRKDVKLTGPLVETPTHWLTLGFDEDLDVAVKRSLRGMIDFLAGQKGLTRLDAYQLASVAADLRVTQVVDGNKGIHTVLPKAIFR